MKINTVFGQAVDNLSAIDSLYCPCYRLHNVLCFTDGVYVCVTAPEYLSQWRLSHL